MSALVVNRLFSTFGADRAGAGCPPTGWPTAGSPPVTTRSLARDLPDPLAYGELRRNLEEFLVVATREEGFVAELAGEVAPAPVARVPFLREDVHDVEGLRAVARHLLGGKLVSDVEVILIVSDSELRLEELRIGP